MADNDPTVALVQVRKVDGTLFNGEGTDGFVLDTCGKRSLMLYYSILNAAGIKLTEVTWPEAITARRPPTLPPPPSPATTS